MTRTNHRASVVTALLVGIAIGTWLGFAWALWSLGHVDAAERKPAVTHPPSTPRPTPATVGIPPRPSPVVVGGPPSAAPSPGALERSVPALPDTATLSGLSTWYCSRTSPCTRGYGPSDLVAAIDPTTGIGRGAKLVVTHDGRSVTVTVVDVCACRGARIIDLTSGAFSRLAPLSAGVIPVTVVTAGPNVTPPATETQP